MHNMHTSWASSSASQACPKTILPSSCAGATAWAPRAPWCFIGPSWNKEYNGWWTNCFPCVRLMLLLSVIPPQKRTQKRLIWYRYTCLCCQFVLICCYTYLLDNLPVWGLRPSDSVSTNALYLNDEANNIPSTPCIALSTLRIKRIDRAFDVKISWGMGSGILVTLIKYKKVVS